MDDRYGVISETVAQNGCSICSDGFGTITYSYRTNTFISTTGIDNNWWQVCTTETLPDDTPSDSDDNDQIVTYTNHNGQVILQEVIDKHGTDSTSDDQKYLTWYHYDTSDQLDMEAHPSAVVNFSESLETLVSYSDNSYILQNSGLVEKWIYSTSTTSNISLTQAGDVAGYLQSHVVGQGMDPILSGTAITTESWTYKKISGDNGVAYPIATDTVYANTDGTGARTTCYDYTAYSNTTMIATEVVHAPIVTADQNGPGTADITKSAYDTFGRTIWTVNANGSVTFMRYDSASGAVAEAIRDINLSNTSVSALESAGQITSGEIDTFPSTWTQPSSGLNLITSYKVDALGRTLIQTDPNGNRTFTVYDDINHAVYTFSALAGSLDSSGNGTVTSATSTPVPVQVTRTDIPYHYTLGNTTYNGSYDESMNFSFTGNLTVSDYQITLPGYSTSNPALVNLIGNGTSGSPQFTIQSLSRTLYNTVGQTIEADAYSSITNTTYLATSTNSPYSGTSTTNFNATLYGYDGQGRQNKVTTPNLTITRTLYDARGNVVSTWIRNRRHTNHGLLVALPFNAGVTRSVKYQYQYLRRGRKSSSSDDISWRRRSVAYDFLRI